MEEGIVSYAKNGSGQIIMILIKYEAYNFINKKIFHSVSSFQIHHSGRG